MLNRYLPANPLVRQPIVAAGSLVALLVFTQLVLPGKGGSGTPGAILFQGLVAGSLLALTAVGTVIVYRALRIVNFAQSVIGIVGGSMMTLLLQFTEVGFIIAFLAALLVSAFIGALMGIITLRFFSASRLFLTVFTIVSVPFIFSLLPHLQNLPFLPSGEELSIDEAVITAEEFRRLLPLAGLEFQIGSFPLKFGFGELFAIEASLVALIGVAAFFRWTKTGVAIRALSENPERASLLGIGVGGLSIIVWTLAGTLSGFTHAAGVALSGQTFGTEDPTFLLPILAAAVLAKFSSIPKTIAISFAMGVIRAAWLFSYETRIGVYNLGLLLAVAVALFVQRRASSRSESGEISWAASDEPRPVPKELSSITGIRIARYSLVVLVLIGVTLFPFIAETDRIFLIGSVYVNAIAVLSLVVLTGWAGQVSLGQYALVAVGSVVGGSLSSKVGIPFWFAVPMAAAITAVVSMIVGLPALRIRGLLLLVTTFGFAVAVQQLLFDEDYFGWLLPAAVERPTLFFLDFEDERSMYFLSLLALVLAVIVVRNLRRSRVGRLLIALRENEANVQAFGVSALRAKLLASAIAGSLAGFSGAMFAHQQRSVAQESFTALANVDVFIQAVIGGVSSPAGALLGSFYFTLANEFIGDNAFLATFFNGFGPLAILFLAPGGLISLFNAVRDSVLRIVAQRRRIIVPSLFADYDPDVLANRLIPLGDPSPTSGLGALPPEARYALASELYQGTGERIIDKLAPVKETQDAAAIGAAARAAEEIDVEMEAVAAGSQES